MELAVREYTDWAEEESSGGGDPVEELLRTRADEARCPVQTWLMPVVDDMDRCIRNRFLPRILQEMNTRLAGGELSMLLGRPVVSERIAPRELEIGGVSCWRLNRTDFLADIDLSVTLTVEESGRDVSLRPGFCLSLWFCTEEGFSFEVQELHTAENKPDRSFWKLDRRTSCRRSNRQRTAPPACWRKSSASACLSCGSTARTARAASSFSGKVPS